MPVYYKVGDLLESNCDYICHQVNCVGRMGSGIAKQIHQKWPIVYDEYTKYCNYTHSDSLLGLIQQVKISENKNIINMFAQYNYGRDGKRYTSYDAFWMCLGEIKNTIPKGSEIGFPYRIGCGLGGANWDVIKTMIYTVLGKDYNVYIYCKEEET